MVIAVIMGGYANQLYKYACAYATAKKYHQELIIIAQTSNAATDPFQLGEFALEYSELYVIENYIEIIALIGAWKEKYKLVEVSEANYMTMVTPDLFERYDGVMLFDNFQRQVFFEDYVEDLRSIFYFKKETAFLKKFRKEIAGKESVAVHVRRGDFLTYENLRGMMEYYRSAMCFLEDILGYGRAEYYIFSDDRDFVRSYFGRNKRIHYVSVYGDYREAVEEFFAISMCSHRILTEASSFSRMADVLNSNPEGYSIYEKLGFEHWLFAKENIVLMEPDMISGLSDYYAPLFERDIVPEKAISEEEILNLDLPRLLEQCIDSRDIEKEREIAFRIRKIELMCEQDDYAEALGQARKLWEVAIGTKYEHKMHELYWLCLYGYGYRLESIIEAVFLEDIRKAPEQWYHAEEQAVLHNLYSAKRNMEIVMIPSRRFEPHVFEDMIHTGILLKRLGYAVTFMVWELTPDMVYFSQYNKTLETSACYEDVMGHSSRCPLINLTKKEMEYGSVKDFFDSYFAQTEQIVLFTKQNKVLEAVGECAFLEKITTVFWDYSHVRDAGNYKEVNLGLIKKSEIGPEEIQECYDCADYSITFSETMPMRDSILHLKESPHNIYEPGKEKRGADYYRTDSAVIENTFAIIENIINNVGIDKGGKDKK